MDPRRLRPADWLCIIASVALLVLLGLEWVSGSGGQSTNVLNGPAVAGVFERTQSGYAALGWFVVALLVVAALGGVVLAALTAIPRMPDAYAVAVQVLLTPFALLVTLVLLVELLLQPGLGVGAPNAAVGLEWPAYAGLLATALIFVGAWRSMADERTDARHMQVTPPPARPAPPATA